MTKDEALAFDLALEALKSCSGVPHWPALQPAITAIKQVRAKDALYKLAEESCTSGLRLDDWDKIGCVNHDCDKCKAVQEPVAWRWKNNGEDKWLNEYVYLDRGGPDCPEECEPLYTTPPAAQRQWQSLTDEEVMQTMSGDWTSQFYFARAIEAKLKELNK